MVIRELIRRIEIKKFSTVFVAVGLALTVSACGDDDDNGGPIVDTPAGDEQDLNWENLTLEAPCPQDGTGDGVGNGNGNGNGNDGVCTRDQNRFVVSNDGTFVLNGVAGVLRVDDFRALDTLARDVAGGDVQGNPQCENANDAKEIRLQMTVMQPADDGGAEDGGNEETTRVVDIYREDDSENKRCILGNRQNAEELNESLQTLMLEYLKVKPGPSPTPGPSPSPSPSPSPTPSPTPGATPSI